MQIDYLNELTRCGGIQFALEAIPVLLTQHGSFQRVAAERIVDSIRRELDCAAAQWTKEREAKP